MTNLNKTEKVIAGVALSAIAVFIFMFFQISKSSGSRLSKQFESANSINYKMARPEQVYSEYTLNGRELDQTYEALSPAEKKLMNKKKQALLVKELTKKKKEELKKNQIAAATAKAQVMAKTRAQVAAAARESRVAQAEYKKVTSERAQAEAYSNQSYNNQTAKSPDAPDADPKAVAKKSFAQWRTLLFDQPTSENLGAFITAYRKNEVTMTEYQAMAQDLLDQNDEKLKGFGLQALRSVPSFQSYSQLVHIQSTLSATLQSYVETSLLAYLQPQNLGFLNQALASSDKVVLLKSLTVLSANLEKLNQGDASSFSDPRTRGASSTGVTMNTFRTLLPSLGTISSSQDQELAAIAHSLVTLINQANSVAIN